MASDTVRPVVVGSLSLILFVFFVCLILVFLCSI